MPVLRALGLAETARGWARRFVMLPFRGAEDRRAELRTLPPAFYAETRRVLDNARSVGYNKLEQLCLALHSEPHAQ